MSKDTDPLKIFNKTDRLYCNVNNKNNLSFTCFSENDIYELITIYNSDIANVTNEKIKKNTQNELYPIINIRDSNNKKKPIKTIYDELKNNLSKYKKKIIKNIVG